MSTTRRFIVSGILLLAVCGGAKKGPPILTAIGPPRVGPLGRWAPGTLPLSVVLVPELRGVQGEIQDAMDWWNTRLGREVFLRIGELQDGGLVVFGSCDAKVSPCVGDDVGRAKMVVGDDGFAHRAHVWLRNKPQFAERAAAHELGHALGLQHVCVIKHRRGSDTPAFMPSCGPEHAKGALMYPTIDAGDYHLTDADRAMLRTTLPP